MYRENWKTRELENVGDILFFVHKIFTKRIGQGGFFSCENKVENSVPLKNQGSQSFEKNEYPSILKKIKP